MLIPPLPNWPKQLVAAEKEAAVPSFEEFIALPWRDEIFGHETPRNLVNVGRKLAARLALQLRNEGLQPVLFHQPTPSHEVEECFDVGFGHAHSSLADPGGI